MLQQKLTALCLLRFYPNPTIIYTITNGPIEITVIENHHITKLRWYWYAPRKCLRGCSGAFHNSGKAPWRDAHRVFRAVRARNQSYTA